MKTIIKMFLLFLINFSLTYGYGGQPPPLPSFVSSSVEGQVHQAPLFLSDTNKVTIFTQVSLSTPTAVDGNIDINGTVSAYPKSSNSNNLNWQIPGISFNTGASIKMGSSAEIFGTIKLGNMSRGFKVSGSDFGLGLLFKPDKNFRGRLDLGLSYIATDAETILKNSFPDTATYSTTENKKGVGPFISLTLNTSRQEWTVNPYIQVSFCRLTFFSIESYRNEIYSAINLLAFSPGITYRLSRKILIIAGGNFTIPFGLEDRSSPGIISGYIQTNFLL